MTRGGSAGRSPIARSAAARKGWVRRKMQAAARVRAKADAPAPGSQADRVLQGHEIKPLIDRVIGSLREREREREAAAAGGEA